MRRVGDLVGIEEGFLARAVRGRILTRTEQQRQSLAVHRRFFAALALQDLVHEVPLNVVARRYGANRGMLQSLQGSAATFAGMVTVFCEKLGWTNMELLLSQFQSRLSFGVVRELCDLVRISLLNAARARMLYTAGYHTIASVAAAPPSAIENILHNAAPFVSGLKRGQETETEVRERSEARVIWVAGRRGLTMGNAAKLIVNEAKQLLQADVAQLGIEWKPSETEENKSNISSVADIRPNNGIARSTVTFQSGAGARVPARTDKGCKMNVEKSNAKSCASDPSTDLQRNRLQPAQTGITPDGSHGQEIVKSGKQVKQVVVPSSLANKVPIISSVGSSLANVPPKESVNNEATDHDVTCRAKGKITESVASKLRYEDCASTSVAQLQPTVTCHAKEKPHTVSSPLLTSDDVPRSRKKRRSPISVLPGPQEKLTKKETASVDISEVPTSGPNESENASIVAEVSSDSKLCNEVQSVSVELYSEPFEGEEPAVQVKPVAGERNDNHVLLDSQALAACSLSDTCLMECDVMITDSGQNPAAHVPPVKRKDSPSKVMRDRDTIVVKPPFGNVAADQSQELIGEYDTQPRLPGTGEFHVERSFELVSSLTSPVPHSSRSPSANNDLVSPNIAHSFSLRLSSSDGCLDSDLSTLAAVELIEKEAEAKNIEGKTETAVISGDDGFTKVKELKIPIVSGHVQEKSPAKKIPRKELQEDLENKGSEALDSDLVPSTPPVEKKPSQDDFKTRTSATPLSTRKRLSPRYSRFSNTPDEGLAIVDVTGHERVFSMFLKEWRSQTRYSLAVACERVLDNVPRIGGRFTTNVPTSEGTSRGLTVEGEDQVVVGIAVSWGDKDAYYVSFKEHAQSSPNQADDSQTESAVDNNLTLDRRVNALKDVVQFLTEQGRFMVCFDVKEHFKVRKTE